MYFAVVGDVHGHQYQMESLLDEREALLGIKFDFVLQVGDFEAIGDEADLESMACPSKYKKMGDFNCFIPPISEGGVFKRPVYFIGGNHEGWSYLDSRGGKGFGLVNNCTFLGRAFMTNLFGIKIAGLSGIYSPTNYENDKRGRLRGKHYEIASKKLFTYFFKSEVDFLLSQGKCDILMTHDWPKGAVTKENAYEVKGKRRSGDYLSIGNEPARQLVDSLRPQLIVSGHMHYKHRSKINDSQFAAMAIINAGQDAIGVFGWRDGQITEVE